MPAAAAQPQQHGRHQPRGEHARECRQRRARRRRVDVGLLEPAEQRPGHGDEHVVDDVDDDGRLEPSRAPREVAAEDGERPDLDDDPRVERAVGRHERRGRQQRRHDEGDDGGAEPRADALHEAAAERDLLAGRLERRGEEADDDEADPLLRRGGGPPGRRAPRWPRGTRPTAGVTTAAQRSSQPHRRRRATDSTRRGLRRWPAQSPRNVAGIRAARTRLPYRAAPRVGAELLDGVGQQAGHGEHRGQGAGEQEPRRRGHEPGEERAPPAVAGAAHLVHVGTGLRLGCRDRPPRRARASCHCSRYRARRRATSTKAWTTGCGVPPASTPTWGWNRVRTKKGCAASARTSAPASGAVASTTQPCRWSVLTASGDGAYEQKCVPENGIPPVRAPNRLPGTGVTRRCSPWRLQGSAVTTTPGPGPSTSSCVAGSAQHRAEELQDGVLEPAAGAEERHALLAGPADGPEDGLVVGVGRPGHEPDAVEPGQVGPSWAPSWAPTTSRRRARAARGWPPARGGSGGRPGRPRGRCARSWPTFCGVHRS